MCDTYVAVYVCVNVYVCVFVFVEMYVRTCVDVYSWRVTGL